MTEPASIRFNNPGAMWGGKHADRWGAVSDVVLNDGQSNHIAVFKTRINGAAAQFDLWRIGYAGKTLADAIDKWSGHNSPKGYVAALQQATGIQPSDFITTALLAGPKGVALMKAQAAWEAGRPYPMTDDEWLKAQQMVFGGAPQQIPAQASSGGIFAAINNAVLSIFRRG